MDDIAHKTSCKRVRHLYFTVKNGLSYLTSFPTVIDAMTFFTASFFFSFLSLLSSAFSSKISPEGSDTQDHKHLWLFFRCHITREWQWCAFRKQACCRFPYAIKEKTVIQSFAVHCFSWLWPSNVCVALFAVKNTSGTIMCLQVIQIKPETLNLI